MPRPARAIWVPRTYARRRHRSWMLSMTMATLGWACWWVALVLARWAPDAAPPAGAVGAVAAVFAVAGLGLAVLSVRARRTWLLFTVVPVFANASLLLLPWIAGGELEAG